MHYDTDATLHRVVLNNLEVGEYEYQCGEEGAYSDISTFVVRKYQKTANENNYIKDYNYNHIMAYEINGEAINV